MNPIKYLQLYIRYKYIVRVHLFFNDCVGVRMFVSCVDRNLNTWEPNLQQGFLIMNHLTHSQKSLYTLIIQVFSSWSVGLWEAMAIWPDQEKQPQKSLNVVA